MIMQTRDYSDRYEEIIDPPIERKGNGSARPPRFKLIHFADLKPSTSGNYAVKGLIPRTGIAVVWGPPKCGKSFWTFDLAMHSALGWDLCQKPPFIGS